MKIPAPLLLAVASITALPSPCTAQSVTDGTPSARRLEVLFFGAPTGNHPGHDPITRYRVLKKHLGDDGINLTYSEDPVQNPAARRYDEITFTQCLAEGLGVMDQTAFALCRDGALEVVVFDMRAPGRIREAALGKRVGSRIVPDAG